MGRCEIVNIIRTGNDVQVELTITRFEVGMPSRILNYDLLLAGYGAKSDDDIQQEASRLVIEKWDLERL
jgi:hypothetical protein